MSNSSTFISSVVFKSTIVDCYAWTTNILANSKKYQRHPISIADGRVLYVTWDKEMLSQGITNGYFYIGDVVAVPLELSWDSDICHETLVPFDEKMVIDAYIEQTQPQIRRGRTLSIH